MNWLTGGIIDWGNQKDITFCNVEKHHSAWRCYELQRVMENSSIETILTEGPEGPAGWEGKGLVPTLRAVGGAITIAPLPIKSWILYMRVQQLLVSCTRAAM